MSVTNGQQANDTTFNTAFVSKTANSTVISKVTLNRSGSGAQVPDVQQGINDNIANIATNASNISTNTGNIASNESRITSLEGSLPQSNFAATTDPTITNDSSGGYSVGSTWINITADAVFKAVDVTVGAAIWKRIDKVRLNVSQTAVLDMSVSNVTDAAWVEIVADTGANVIKRISSFYPAGSIAEIGVGAAASEVRNFILYPGGNGEVGVDVTIPANSRLSIRLLTGETAVTNGKLAMNLLSEV